MPIAVNPHVINTLINQMNHSGNILYKYKENFVIYMQ